MYEKTTITYNMLTRIYFSFQNWYGLISTTLAAILLLGSSTLIGILLSIQSELGNGGITRKQLTDRQTTGIRGAIGLTWLLPILYAMAGPLVYTIVDNWPVTWWLSVNSFGFVLYIIIELLFVILFILLFYTLIKKLLHHGKKHDKPVIMVSRR